MKFKKVTVKTTDGHIHRYNNVILRENGNARAIIIELTNKDTVVFPLDNVIFYSFKS